MERGRVIEIIEAYGGYPAAWPEDERAAAERLALSDAALIALMNDAREVDRMLRDWACELVPTTDADADAAADRALAEAYRSGAPRRMWMRAAFGGAIAASLAIAPRKTYSARKRGSYRRGGGPGQSSAQHGSAWPRRWLSRAPL